MNLFIIHFLLVLMCGGICNTIDDLYPQICVPNKVKNMNVKVFDLMSRLEETRFLV